VNQNYVYGDLQDIDWQALHDQHLASVQTGLSDEEFAEAMRAMLVELPPGTAVWQTRSERIEQDMRDNSTYEGIGAYVAFRVAPDPHIVLLSVMPESPAEQAGLEAHDSILSIEDLPVSADEGLAAVERIRGPAGSQVTLHVRSPGVPSRDVAVTRERVTAADGLQLGFAPGSAIGYLLFPPAAYDELAEDVLRSLEALASAPELNGLILDLRVSSVRGGWPLNALLALFADGSAGEFYTRAKVEVLTIEGQDYANSQNLPLAILVGPDTGGSAEIFAAAMQAVGRASVLGLPTQGDVEGMSEFSLPNGSRVFVSTTSYRAPDGREIGLTGVEPDVEIRADWDTVTSQDDPVRDAAVDALRYSGG
jgi:carboxyl-terminal processing protease